MDRIITLENLKEFKRLLDEKLPDMLEAALSSKDEKPVYGIEILKSGDLQTMEAEGTVETQILFAPKVVGWNDVYQDEMIDLSDNLNPLMAQLYENTYGVSPLIFLRVIWPKDWTEGANIWLKNDNDGADVVAFEHESASTDTKVVEDLVFNLNEFKDMSQLKTVTLNVYQYVQK